MRKITEEEFDDFLFNYKDYLEKDEELDNPYHYLIYYSDRGDLIAMVTYHSNYDPVFEIFVDC